MATYIEMQTKVITSVGFKLASDIEVGDILFNEKGEQTKVIGKGKCRGTENKVTFGDKSELSVSENSELNTWMHRDRKAYLRSIKTVDSNSLPSDWVNWKGSCRLNNPTGTGPTVKSLNVIKDTLTHSKRSDTNHSIPLTQPLNFDHINLNLDSYLAGYWVGDGCRKTNRISVSLEDKHHIENYVTVLGYSMGTLKDPNMVSVLSLSSDLREASESLYNEKIIPLDYIYNNYKERLQFLRGLMDSDGYISDVNGAVEFCSKTKPHADCVMFIVRSLGFRPTLRTGRAMLNGKDYGIKYRVFWHPTKNVNPFNLERKAELVRDKTSQGFRSTHRMLKYIKEGETKDFISFEVDTNSKMFLAGESLVPVVSL